MDVVDSHDPGPLPSRTSPQPGETFEIFVDGEPPCKDTHYSIRNPKHSKYQSFVMLRRQAIDAMAGRRWFDGPVGVDLTIYAPRLGEPLVEYLGGIMDTLDGSHGFTFTYLPVVYQDDCQVVSGDCRFEPSGDTNYRLKISFLSDEGVHPPMRFFGSPTGG